MTERQKLLERLCELSGDYWYHDEVEPHQLLIRPPDVNGPDWNAAIPVTDDWQLFGALIEAIMARGWRLDTRSQPDYTWAQVRSKNGRVLGQAYSVGSTADSALAAYVAALEAQG